MKAKRILSFLLVLAMLATCLTGCGRGATPASGESNRPAASSKAESTKEAQPEDAGEEDDQGEASSDDNGTGEEGTSNQSAEKGEELSTFINQYFEAKQIPMDKLSESINESSDFTLIMSMLGVAMVDMYIAFVPMFDVVDEVGYVAMLNLKNAYRKEKGDVITFGADYVREEDSGDDLKGDREYWEGELDQKDESMRVLYYTERNGKVIDKTVMEITKNKDRSFTSQTLTFQVKEEGGEELSAYFIQFEGEDISVISGTKPNAKADFNFESVFKTRNADIRDLSEGYELSLDLSYKDGEVANNLKE